MAFIVLLIVSICAAAVNSMPFENEDFPLEEEDYVSYLDETLVRQRRSPQFKVTGEGSEKQGFLRVDGTKTLLQNDRTKIDGHAGYQHNYGGGPKHMYNFGASGTQNIWRSRDRSASLDANAHFNRQFGAGRPTNNYGGGLSFTKRF